MTTIEEMAALEAEADVIATMLHGRVDDILNGLVPKPSALVVIALCAKLSEQAAFIVYNQNDGQIPLLRCRAIVMTLFSKWFIRECAAFDKRHVR